MDESAPSATTTIGLLLSGVARHPDALSFAIPEGPGEWSDLATREFLDGVRSLAKGLLAAELRHGDALGVLSSTRFEATLLDFAAATVGVAVVPLEARASQADLTTLLDDSGVQAVVVETPRDFARIDELLGDLPQIADVWQIDLGDLDKLAELGRGVADALLDDRTALVTGDTIAVVAPSSGGDPRSLIRLSHRTLTARATALTAALEGATGADSALLQILPRTDVHARVVELVAVATGTRLGHLADSAAMIETMASFRPTLLVARPDTVARIFEAASERIDFTGRAAGLRQGLDVAVEHSVAVASGTVSRGLKTRFALADALVYRGLRRAVGGRLRIVVSIATEESLSPRLRHIMRSLDLRPLEGYGTAETAGLATLERPDDPFDRPVGGVGAPLAGVEIAIAPDGSVAFRGTGVTGGSEGWFASGLFGEVDGGRLIFADRDIAPDVDDEHEALADQTGSSAAADL